MLYFLFRISREVAREQGTLGKSLWSTPFWTKSYDSRPFCGFIKSKKHLYIYFWCVHAHCIIVESCYRGILSYLSGQPPCREIFLTPNYQRWKHRDYWRLLRICTLALVQQNPISALFYASKFCTSTGISF